MRVRIEVLQDAATNPHALGGGLSHDLRSEILRTPAPAVNLEAPTPSVPPASVESLAPLSSDFTASGGEVGYAVETYLRSTAVRLPVFDRAEAQASEIARLKGTVHGLEERANAARIAFDEEQRARFAEVDRAREWQRYAEALEAKLRSSRLRVPKSARDLRPEPQ